MLTFSKLEDFILPDGTHIEAVPETPGPSGATGKPGETPATGKAGVDRGIATITRDFLEVGGGITPYVSGDLTPGSYVTCKGDTFFVESVEAAEDGEDQLATLIPFTTRLQVSFVAGDKLIQSGSTYNQVQSEVEQLSYYTGYVKTGAVTFALSALREGQLIRVRACGAEATTLQWGVGQTLIVPTGTTVTLVYSSGTWHNITRT